MNSAITTPVLLGVALLALVAGTATAEPAAPRYGTFTDAAKAQAIAEAQAEGPLRGHDWEADDSHEEELRLEEAARMRQGGLRMIGNDDNDTAHYKRGRTLVINIFVNHTGGTWSTAEKEDKAARNSVAKDFFLDNAPANANVYFDNQGTNGYWEYTATLPYNIPTDGFTWEMTEDAVAALGFGDGDGDTYFVDDLTIWLQNWGGGWDNVLAVFQPADITGRAFASYAFARTRIYTDDSANVRAHEWGHLFGSCDEYVESGGCNGDMDCGACQSTYLTDVIDNGNCQLVTCPTDVGCVMINNTFSAICPYTREHWGWVDDDSNGQADLVKRRVMGNSFANIYELWDGGWFLWNSTSHGMVAHQNDTAWGVVGLRSPSTADYDMHLYGENNHRYELASSSYAGQTVDFVVGDYNHSPLGNEHVEIVRYSGASDDYRLGYESGGGTLYPDGVDRAGSWTAESVVRVWDVPLFAGETVTFVLDVTSGSTDFGMSLFRSFGGEYWAGRSSAQWTRDAAGDAGTESWTYTVPADDVYGLVIFANNPADGNFTIQIGPTPATLAEETPFLSGLDLRLFDYDPNAAYWSVVGNRPAAGTNTTVRLFNDATYVTPLEISDDYNAAGPPNNADFIAVDYNHASGVPDYLRVIRESGAGTHRTEWEHDADIISGILPSAAWDAGHVAKVWDAYLQDGVPYMLRSYSGGIDQGLYVFRSGDGDYYKQRAAFAGAANFRTAAEGEWFSYTATESDWHGIVQIVNDESSGSYANWLGRKITLANDVALTNTDEVQWGTGTANTSYWHVFGVRPSAGQGASISLYGDDGYTISTLKASDQSGTGVVNFVVGDYNHNPAETVYPRVWRTSGSGALDVEMEAGTESLIWLGAGPVSTVQSWPAGDVVEVYDVFLPAGTNVHVQLNTLSGSPDLGMALFKSNGATYYAAPTSAVDQADVNGAGGSEAFEYFSPAADWYGLVVFNQNDNAGSYEIIIGSPSATDAAVVAGPAALDLATSPNPFREGSDFRFSVPREDRVSLSVFDAAGRLVRSLVDDTVGAGSHTSRWDGRDDAGRRVATGVYFARLSTSEGERIRKVIRVQ